MFYASKIFQNCELFVEFFFEILNERSEPAVTLVELAKAICKLKEYKELIEKENINTYIEMEVYQELKMSKQAKEKQLHLARSKKILPKLATFKVPEKLAQLKKQRAP